ncbi:MAG: hypothetical protein HRU15_02855 [Planctomycetes bacterium]|nr:hypothetical protein [Planctomycetota bacterium]
MRVFSIVLFLFNSALFYAASFVVPGYKAQWYKDEVELSEMQMLMLNICEFMQQFAIFIIPCSIIFVVYTILIAKKD